jgi:hypothetical protein
VHDRALGTSRKDRWRKVGLLLVGLWAVLFLLGAVGEVFEVEALRRMTDLKQFFLR